MVSSQKILGLEWLVNEVEASMLEACDALDSYGKNNDQDNQLRFCLDYIHQVTGSLKITQCYGGALLSEEMEAVIEACLTGAIASFQEAIDVLGQATAEVPNYLRKCIASGIDQPALLLTLLNDLRAIRNEPLVSGSQFFKPDLTVLDNPRPLDAGRFLSKEQPLQVFANKLSQVYQHALLAYVKGEDESENIVKLAKVLYRLKEISLGSKLEQLWRVAGVALECLSSGALLKDRAIVSLFWEVAANIRELSVEGMAVCEANYSPDLLKNLLYYITVADPGTSPRRLQIRREFKLDEALPAGVLSGADGGLIPSYDQDVVKALASELGVELEGVKTHLNSLTQGAGEADSLAGTIGLSLNRVADTLAMVGQEKLRVSVQELELQVQSTLADGSSVNQGKLLQIVTHLGGVEAALDTWASSYRPGVIAREPTAETAHIVNEAQQALFREVRDTLEVIKDAIVGYISSQWDTKFLQDAPAQIDSIKGAMVLVKMERMARIIAGLGGYLRDEFIASSNPPGWDRLDSLADIITAIDHFFEVMMTGADDESEASLDGIEGILSALGYDVKQPVQPTGQETSERQEVASESMAIDVRSDARGLEPGPGSETPTAPYLSGDVAEPDNHAINEPDQEDEEPEGLDEDIDEEIIEIFVEEAREILQSLETNYPHWLEQREDGAALAEVRRSFHSLKGSGRMVNAHLLGELGFVVEQLFNKVIDSKLVFDGRGEALLDRVLAAIPVLVNEFEAGRQSDNAEATNALVKAVDAYICGETIDQSPVVEFLVAPQVVAPQSPEPAVGEPKTDNIEIEAASTRTVDVLTAARDLIATSEPRSDKTMVQSADADIEEHSETISGANGHTSEDAQYDQTQDKLDATRASLISPVERDQTLTSIFIDEAHGHIRVLAKFIDDLNGPPFEALANNANALRSLHMLKGSACVAEVGSVAELAEPLEKLVKDITRGVVRVDDDVITVLQDVVEGLRELVGAAGNINPELFSRSEVLQHRIQETEENHRIATGEHADVFSLNTMLVSGLARVLEVPELLDNWQGQPKASNSSIEELSTELMALAEAAELARCSSLSVLAKQYADALIAYNTGQLETDDSAFGVFYLAYECLLDMVDSFVADQTIKAAPESLISKLVGLTKLAEVATIDVSTSVPDQLTAESEVIQGEQEAGSEKVDAYLGRDEKRLEAIQLEPAQPMSVESNVGLLEDERAQEDIDPEIISIFIEEAEELLDRIEQAIQGWRENPGHNQYQETVIRELHTLKGGARVAGFISLGDMSHDFETFIESEASTKSETGFSSDIPGSFFAALFSRYDALAALYDQIKTEVASSFASPTRGTRLSAGDSNISQSSSQTRLIPEPPDSTAKSFSVDTKVSVETDRGEGVQGPGQAATTKIVSPGGYRRAVQAPAEKGSRSGPADIREMVKVSASAVDQLVNLAGETSITRGRIEQSVNEFTLSLDEMEATVIRLQDQVRRMGKETEAQILFRREQIESSDDSDDFDPLELDRYSQFQHLFSALQESASDLQEVKETLISNVKTAELSLSQQSQVTTDLQESLMLTRMVPFARLVPRLRRVVRQTSAEVGKSASLQLNNVDGDLDRTVLEKIVGPLEHMIRNAVDHGIEDSVTRLSAGKPAEGKISLSFGRESSEITIRMSDDGKGLDIDAIRKRAIDRGLVLEDTQIAPQELLQLIFLPGFSTAGTLSQTSGRGVGLDVVVNEVRQLGGSVRVSSEPGVGTEFNIRVPFTLSVNRALMIGSGDERYALPLNTIVGVVQMTVAELAECNKDSARQLYYGGEGYRICALSQLLGKYGREQVLAAGGNVSLVLVATGNYRFAVQVDSLEGSQEIAIKSLGSMFNPIPGLSGITTMGDGAVVVILDLVTLLRTQGAMESAIEGGPLSWEQSLSSAGGVGELVAAEGGQSEDLVELKGQQTRTIMVVDDSVTVRKVTTRFLEREGFEVVTAKDGVDAVDILEDISPDLMLLDIEMPRMDGFDVARVVRNNTRLKTLPIVMISSRSGSKHRDKAASCGVNHFLGKPYREDELLELITDMLDA